MATRCLAAEEEFLESINKHVSLLWNNKNKISFRFVVNLINILAFNHSEQTIEIKVEARRVKNFCEITVQMFGSKTIISFSKLKGIK